MTAQAVTLHFPAAIECEVTDKVVPIDSSLPLTLTNVSGLREFHIRAVTRADDENVHVYQCRDRDADLAPRRSVRAVGDLNLGDIDRTSISIEWNGDTISGVIRDIRTDTDTVLNSLMIGDRHYRRGDRRTRVRISFKNFVVSDLPIDHPCEVIS